MPRSFLDQLLQVAASSVYDDAVATPHVVGTAEGQTTLEGDLNIVRTLLKDLAGTTNWFDTTDMNVQGIARKFFIVKMHRTGFENVSVTGSSTTGFDAAIKLIPNHADGAGTATTLGVILNATTPYKLALRDHATQNPIDDGSNNEVYGRLTWNGSAYVVSFYSMVSGTETAYSFASAQTVDMAYVAVSYRYEDLPWETFLDFTFWDLAGPVGAISDSSVNVAGMQYLYNGLTNQHSINLKGDKLGHADTNSEGAHLIAIDDTATGSNGYFTGTMLQIVLNELKTQIGGLTSGTYNFTNGAGSLLTDNDYVYPALNKLDQGFVKLLANNTAGQGANLVGVQDLAGVFAGLTVEAVLKELYDSIQDVVGWVKKSETTSSPINSGSAHTLPNSMTYTLGGGDNLDVYFDGQLLLEGASNDYVENNTTSIKFNFTVPTNKNLTYMARK
jgi:hypothetical protein